MPVIALQLGLMLDTDSIAMSHSRVIKTTTFLLERNHYLSPWVEPGKSTVLRHPTNGAHHEGIGLVNLAPPSLVFPSEMMIQHYFPFCCSLSFSITSHWSMVHLPSLYEPCYCSASSLQVFLQVCIIIPPPQIEIIAFLHQFPTLYRRFGLV
jgi:hypothetical protein